MQNNMTISGCKISTWYAEHSEPPYQAVVMCVANEGLKDYGLTEEQKTSIPELMAGYCRLVEEAGWVGYGETEFEAIQDLFNKAKKVN